MLLMRIGVWTTLFCLSFLVPGSFSGEIYRWEDEKGVVHFTDDISTVPARYRSRIDKREVVDELPKGAEKQIAPGQGPEASAEKEKPDRVSEYLKAVDKKLDEKRAIEKKISKLEEEMKAAEERILQLEKDEEENYPSMQPHRSRGKFTLVETPHHQEKVRLTNRINSIKEEIAILEERLSSIRRSL